MWISARESIQAHTVHPAGHINGAMMIEGTVESRVWSIKYENELMPGAAEALMAMMEGWMEKRGRLR